eukprot:scaffold330383_cov15-Prasinocladus_malaysianus.AAC.1
MPIVMRPTRNQMARRTQRLSQFAHSSQLSMRTDGSCKGFKIIEIMADTYVKLLARRWLSR